MDDRDIVAALAAGDEDGIAYAYDKHAASLYGYCHSIVPQPADAAVALQDTFVIASAKLSGLRDPRRLRPWLYAVARIECRRWLRPADMGQVPRGGTELDPAEREIIELNLGHHLAGSDLAAVLGVSRHHAHALVARARGRLEETLGAPLAARGGDQAARLRPEPRSALPRTLRDEVLRLCVEATPEALAYREWVTRRAGQFGSSGFPRPARRPTRMLAVAGTAAAAAVLMVIASTGIVTVLTFSRSHAPGSLDAARAGGGPATASTGTTRSVTPPGSAPATRSAAAAAGTPADAAPARSRPAPGRPSRTAAPRATSPASLPGWQASSAPPASSAQPSPSPSVSPTATATRAPSPAPSPDLQWPPSPSPSATSFP
jgi:DNA-directed RNA polymerase specialized sigma24 family protein